MRPNHWGPVRPYQPPEGVTIRRVRLSAEEYQRNKYNRPFAVEDNHINMDGTYYRRLIYTELETGILVEVQGPHIDVADIDATYPPYDFDTDLNYLEERVADFMWWPL